jgi:2Fe-2S ferredoxin
MPTLTFVTPGGELVQVEATTDVSVMDAGVRNVVPGMYGLCGGALACVTCHVYVVGDDKKLCGTPSEFEDEMLQATVSPRTPQSRLSCQIPVREGMNDVRFEVPSQQF